MKQKTMTRRALCVMLCVLLLCSLLPPVYATGESSAITGAEMKVGTTQAQVSYTAAVDAVVVAALYDQDTGRMRAVGSTDVGPGSQTITVQLPEARQEGNELRVFLLDRNSNTPLAENWIDDGTENGNVTVGSTLTFGSYEQDNDLTNGNEPISWRILAVENGKALLISEYALDCKPYNETYTDVTWETCTLRPWLNQDFYNAAFGSGEKAKIAVTTVTAEDHSHCGTDAGNDTKDRIFLLSIGEAEKYFVSDDGSHDGWKESHDRACKPTAYAKAQGCWSYDASDEWYDGMCWWWFRSPGSDQDGAANIDYDGRVDDIGISVIGGDGGVRPALWINLSS